MLLVADVGNTSTTFGLFRGRRLLRQWRHATESGRTGARYVAQLKRHLGKNKPTACVFGSVVPQLDRPLKTAVKRATGLTAIAITPRSKLGFKLKVDRPREVGADRVLNTLAALELYGKPAIVLDFGTATTFDCISRGGDYIGGAILLGPDLAAKALNRHTAKLPQVRMAKTRRVIGRNTVECIQAGLYHGYLGMVQHVLKASIRELGGRPKVIATGGLARLFAKDLVEVQAVEPDLTLHGLRLAYAKVAR
jgi:type III pantothenate kinase